MKEEGSMKATPTGETLRKQGFTKEQIVRLGHFRQALWEQQIQQVIVTRRRLEFARWLVATGRISEQ
jgi:hypothetical protein